MKIQAYLPVSFVPAVTSGYKKETASSVALSPVPAVANIASRDEEVHMIFDGVVVEFHFEQVQAFELASCPYATIDPFFHLCRQQKKKKKN